MATATYKLEADWDGDGAFEADITADWLSADIVRGFADPLARVASVGRGSFVLNNAGREYSPELSADVRPRRQVKFSMTVSGNTGVLFRGFIERIRAESGPKRGRRAVLECVDGLALLDVDEAPIPILVDTYAHEVIEDVVAAVYTPPSTNYQKGVTRFPFAAERWSDHEGLVGFEETTAAQKVLDACVSDWGRFFISKAGAPTFYNRHKTALDTSTKLALSDDMRRLGYGRDVGTVFNHVEVTCHPRSVGTVVEVIGRISQGTPPKIEPGESETYTLYYRDPSNLERPVGGKDVVTPVAGTDYTATSDEAGDGDDLTASVSGTAEISADRIEVTLTNNAAVLAHVHGLQVRGLAVRAREAVTMKAFDQDSIDEYQRRKLTVSAPLLSQEYEARLLAEYLLDNYLAGQREVRDVEVLANRSATFLAAARDLELLDRVVVTETQTGLSAYAGYVFGLRHIVRNRHEHALVLDLETAYDVGGTPFRLDSSALNSGHLLIY